MWKEKQSHGISRYDILLKINTIEVPCFVTEDMFASVLILMGACECMSCKNGFYMKLKTCMQT